MEKGRFVELAPLYYAVAVAFSLRFAEAQTEGTLEEFIAAGTGDSLRAREVNGVLLKHGIKIAHELGLVDVIGDEFAPNILRRRASYWDAWRKSIENEHSPFAKFEAAGDGARDWLRRAIDSVNHNFKELAIEEADFEQKHHEWEPIPLDRADKNLQEATKKLDETIEELRKDNGYASTHPEEKTYVLEKLRAVSKRLKEDTQISWMYIRDFALAPLGILAQRFGRAAIGILATAARKTLTDWLKSRGINVLDDLMK